MPLPKPINALVTPTPINAHEDSQPISPTHVSYSFSPLSGKFWHDIVIVEETENDDAGNWESNLDAKFASTLPSISEQCIQLEQDPASSLLAAIPLDSTSPYSKRSPTPSVHASPSMSRTPSKSKPSKSHSSISPSPRSSSSSSYAPPISKAKQRKLKQKEKRANKVINKPAEIQQGVENSTYWLDEVVKTNQAERAKAELEKASENLSGTPPSQ